MTGRRAVAATAAVLAVASGAVTAQSRTAAAPAGVAAAQTTSASSEHAVRPVLDRYCVSCHNERLKHRRTRARHAGSRHVGNAEVWEKVILKLRAETMPPIVRRRPDAATYGAVASLLEAEIDRAAAASPVRAGRDLPSAQPCRIPQRCSRPAGHRPRRDDPASDRRHVRARLRQQRRLAVDLAGSDSALSERRPQDHPARRRAAPPSA